MTDTHSEETPPFNILWCPVLSQAGLAMKRIFVNTIVTWRGGGAAVHGSNKDLTLLN